MLLGCFALLWYIYKKTKYAFSPRSSLPQHLKEFLGHPHHGTFLVFSFPLSCESDVFDKLNVITESSESSKQNPDDSCSLEAPSGLGPPELFSKEEIYSAGPSDTAIPESPSEGDQQDNLSKHQIYNSQTVDLSKQPED
ncbi:Interleukin-10 receptor subunit beta [Fukomys damarensis]|uniref:Interleukin-10 receptor subunit beta n=2 Tax=Fukomys damarensis TaxID=885580 RepID=A0A091CWG9_FUKDA|nr:Interleukin-10 receptor subunit beta [Fukomys damarensis]